MKIRSLVLVPWFLCPLATAAEQAPAGKQIVFIAGRPSHAAGEHEHRAGCMLLADHLNRSGLGLKATVTTNGWPADDAVLDNAAAIVIYADGGGGHPAVKQLDRLRELAGKGIGIGCIHYAVEVPKGEAGDAFLQLVGGYFETGWSVNPIWEASFVLPPHAVTRGIKNFKSKDEWYYHMRFREHMAGATPILTAMPPPDSLVRPDGPHSGNPEVRSAVLERKQAQHTMWVYDRPDEHGGGRSFGFTGGHFHKNWQIDGQRRIVLNAIAWIAGMEVPEDGIPSPTPSDDEMQANLDPK